MSEDTVVVSQEDAQYIIERQRREIEALRAQVQAHVDGTPLHQVSLLKYVLRDDPWLDRSQLIKSCHECLAILEGGDG